MAVVDAGGGVWVHWIAARVDVLYSLAAAPRLE
jgi:hypothetical protein